MRRPAILSVWAGCWLLVSTPATRAEDPAADLLTHVFMDACVPHIGDSTGVRQWAAQHQLGQIKDPSALALFAGAGDQGAAWAIPAAEGSFALSLRGLTGGCAVWARTADPAAVLVDFKKIVDGVKRPGIELSVDEDKVTQTQYGRAHALVYNVTARDAPRSIEFTLLTVERPGGPFQASIQVAAAGPHAAQRKK